MSAPDGLDPHSATWIAVAKHCQGEIAELTKAIERPMPHDETNVMRGKIAALRAVLRLAGKTVVPFPAGKD